MCVCSPDKPIFSSAPPALQTKYKLKMSPNCAGLGEVGSLKGWCLAKFYCLNVFSSPARVSSTFGKKAKVMKEERVVGQSELRRPWGLLNSSSTNEQLSLSHDPLWASLSSFLTTIKGPLRVLCGLNKFSCIRS